MQRWILAAAVSSLLLGSPLGRVAAATAQEATPTPPQPSPAPGRVWTFGPYVSVQVNVDSAGRNIQGDAANEPSIAVSPVDPERIAIGWRQFDRVDRSFRSAGYAYSRDAGSTWTFPAPLAEGAWHSDPVVASDAEGGFYYLGVGRDPSGRCTDSVKADLYKSTDGGITWSDLLFPFGGDKPWLAIDRSRGMGRGNLYLSWRRDASCVQGTNFARSVDGGRSFEAAISTLGRNVAVGTMSVGPDGAVYLAGIAVPGDLRPTLQRSTNAQDAFQTPHFDLERVVDLGGSFRFGAPQNPGGLAGQIGVATDHSNGAHRGNLYMLASLAPEGDPLDVMFARSEDRGATWSRPLRVNDDPAGAWQWFGTMAVAPNGRIDAIWNDTRNSADDLQSQVFYSCSLDGGASWSPNVAVSPPFDPRLGYPQQSKIGDYYDMVSDDRGANLAYAATFNGEQDVYFLRIPAPTTKASPIPTRLPTSTTTPLPSPTPPPDAPDLDGDGDVDRGDLDILLADRGRDTSESSCGAPCDLDGDGVITALDARRLVVRCTRPYCAPQSEAPRR